MECNREGGNPPRCNACKICSDSRATWCCLRHCTMELPRPTIASPCCRRNCCGKCRHSQAIRSIAKCLCSSCAFHSQVHGFESSRHHRRWSSRNNRTSCTKVRPHLLHRQRKNRPRCHGSCCCQPHSCHTRTWWQEPRHCRQERQHRCCCSPRRMGQVAQCRPDLRGSRLRAGR